MPQTLAMLYFLNLHYHIMSTDVKCSKDLIGLEDSSFQPALWSINYCVYFHFDIFWIVLLYWCTLHFLLVMYHDPGCCWYPATAILLWNLAWYERIMNLNRSYFFCFTANKIIFSDNVLNYIPDIVSSIYIFLEILLKLQKLVITLHDTIK